MKRKGKRRKGVGDNLAKILKVSSKKGGMFSKMKGTLDKDGDKD